MGGGREVRRRGLVGLAVAECPYLFDVDIATGVCNRVYVEGVALDFISFVSF